MEVFTAALEALNPLQRQAVEAIEGPVMVIAGPGTGKTQILTLRIANILAKTQAQPENILALTFTDSGAKAMRARLLRYIGAAAYQVNIYTFHGFAQHLISSYPESFPRIIGGRAATEIEKVEILEAILEDPQFKLLRPMGNHTYYIAPLKSIISHLKQEYVSPDDLGVIIDKQIKQLEQTEQIHQKGAHKGKVRGEYSALEKVISKNQELQQVYRQYEAALKAARLYDFDDMILETVKALSNEADFLAEQQEQYQYVLADEHQDVNGAQNKILASLCNFHASPNIFVVGDEKQAIYRFQGATLSNFLYFTDIFKETETITLTDNYRSGQTILDAAATLIKTDDPDLAKLRVPLLAKGRINDVVSLRSFSHQAVENDWLVSEIKRRVESGTSPSEVAVIVRTNREVEDLSAKLRAAGLPVMASADGDILDHSVTKVVLSLIQALVRSDSEEALLTILQSGFVGLDFSDIIKIAQARSYNLPLSAILADEVKLTELGVKKVSQAKGVVDFLKQAREMEVHEPPHRVLEYLVRESGLLEHLMTNSPHDGVRVLRRLYDEIEAMVIRDGVATLAAVEKTFLRLREYGLPITAPYLATSSEAVQVMTAHKSKGLEFDTVFIPHLVDSAWGGKKRATSFTLPLLRYSDDEHHDPLDDERRLLYVALTRAKQELHLSSASESILGKSLLPSRLLTDEVKSQLNLESTTEAEAAFKPVAVFTQSNTSAFDLTVLSEIIKERGLSATSLNNLLGNPWNFFYRNILRLPQVQPLPMQFGTVVHNVLERTTRAHTETGAWPKLSDLKSWLEVELGRLPISDAEFTRLHEKGLLALTIYKEHLQKSLPGKSKEEFTLKVNLALDLPDLTDITLTGKLDRLDFTSDGLLLQVVDYKTGKPKTRGVIEGTTAGSQGEYKRQLVFYCLLLELYDHELYKTRQGVLSFVEATSRGEIKEEIFTITDEEIAHLREEIEDQVASFLTGDFLTDSELAKQSEYSELALAFISRQS